jgi:hypothetical protein
VSQDLQHYIVLPDNYAVDRRPGDLPICAPVYPVHSSPESSCAIAPFKRDEIAVLEQCHRGVINTPFYTFHHGRNTGEWFYSISEEITFTIDCTLPQEKATARRMPLRGHGKITLPSGCSAKQNKVTLLSTFVFHSERTVETPFARFDSFPFDIPLTTLDKSVLKISTIFNSLAKNNLCNS